VSSARASTEFDGTNARLRMCLTDMREAVQVGREQGARGRYRSMTQLARTSG